MTVYDVGDIARVTLATTNVAGVAADGTLVCALTSPTGVTSAPTVVDDTGTGAYYFDATLNEAGVWAWKVTSSGALILVEDGTLYANAAVTPSTGYITRDQLKAQMGIAITTNDDLLDLAIESASRAIDTYCGRRFYIDAAVSARTYRAKSIYELRVDDIATLTGLIVRTDTADSGTFGTTLTVNTDYFLEPTNNLAVGKPVNKITAVTGLLQVGGFRPRVQVTAKWGWPAVPPEVRSACGLKAARLFRRKDTPEGLAGSGEFGLVRITRAEDPDVCMLLAAFAPGVMVA